MLLLAGPSLLDWLLRPCQAAEWKRVFSEWGGGWSLTFSLELFTFQCWIYMPHWPPAVLILGEEGRLAPSLSRGELSLLPPLLSIFLTLLALSMAALARAVPEPISFPQSLLWPMGARAFSTSRFHWN